MVVHLSMFVCLSAHVTQTNIASLDLVFVYATISRPIHVARSSFILLQFQMFLFVFTYTRKKITLERKDSDDCSHTVLWRRYYSS